MIETMTNKAAVVTKIETHGQLQDLAEVWSDLVDKTEGATIYQTFEWLSSWWQTFQTEHRLLVLLVSLGGEPIGIAPLMLSPGDGSRGRKGVVRFIGTPDIDYGDLIGPHLDIVAQATAAYLWEHRQEWTRIDLSQIRETSPIISTMGQYFRGVGAHYRIVQIETSLAFQYEGTPEAQPLHASPRSEIMRRSAKYFAKAGKFEAREHRSFSDIERHLMQLFHYHVIRWQETDTPSKFLDARYRAFYTELIQVLSKKRRVSLFELSLDGQAQAYCLDFDYRGAIYIYTPLYSFLHRHKAPGNLLFCLIPEFHVRQGYQRIDFGRGAQNNKVDFTNRLTKSYSIEVFRSPIPLAMRRGYDFLKSRGPIQKLINRPALKSAKSHVQSLLAARGTFGALSHLVGQAFGRVGNMEEIANLCKRDKRAPHPGSRHGP